MDFNIHPVMGLQAGSLADDLLRGQPPDDTVPPLQNGQRTQGLKPSGDGLDSLPVKAQRRSARYRQPVIGLAEAP
jgi:hypothetical protein